METQLLSNISSGKTTERAAQSGAATDKKSVMSETSEFESNSSFKDELNDQIDKSNNNQIDNDKVSEQKTESRENRRNEDERELAAAKSGSDKQTVIASEYGISEGAELKDTEETAIEYSPELPLTGILLPQLSGKAQGLNASDARSQLISGQTADPLSALNKPVAAVAESATEIKPLVSEQAVAPVLSQSISRQMDKVNPQFFQSMESTEVEPEIPVNDSVTRAARLQQVPVVTGIADNIAQILQRSRDSLAQTAVSESSVSASPVSLTASGGATTSVNNTLSGTLNGAINASLDSPDWSRQMTQQVSVMLKGNMQKAEIKLNPANLGPLEIKLSMSDDRASITFVAQHAPVRDAIEQAMPRLREMLEQQGLNLSDVDVSTQSEQQQRQHANESEFSKASFSESEDQAENIQAEQMQKKTVNIDSVVNIYA